LLVEKGIFTKEEFMQMVKVGANVKSRFEDALRYYDFKEKGFEILVDQICFPIHGTDTVDLVREALGEQPA
jgi:hypothetical protein